MKKFIFIIIAVIAIAVGITYATDTVSTRQTGGRRLRALLQEMRDEFDGDTILFDLSGTFDNATNNIFEWNENSEGILWTFAGDLVTMSTDTSAVFSFGTMIPNLDGLDVDSYVYFNPISAAPAATEGYMYYDSDDKAMLFRNDSGWVTMAAGTGDNTLELAYNQGSAGGGKAVDVADGAIALSNDDADANPILTISHTGAAAGDGITITVSGGSSDAIEIENTGSGYDIEGTGALWYADKDGSIIGLDLDLTGAGGITLENDETITNVTNGQFNFATDTEDVCMQLINDAVSFKSNTGVDSWAFGAVDDLSGIGSLAFDPQASTVTLTSDETADDLTISLAGTTNSSLILTSAGTGADAVKINASDGALDLDAADGIAIDVAGASGEDIVVTNTGGSIILEATQGAADAIVLEASTALGGIDIISNADIDITTTGTGDEDITITNTGGSVNITATEAAATAITVDASDAAGGITVDYGTGNMVVTGTGASADFTLDADLISIDGKGASNITFTNGANEDVTISTAGAADHSLIIQATGTTGDALQVITTAGGIDITNGGAASGEDFDIVNTNASMNIGAGEDVEDAIVINASTGGINVTADGASAKDLDLVCTNGSTNISGGEADAAAVTIAAGAGGVTIDTAATYDIALTATGGSVPIIATEAAANQFKVDARGIIAGYAIVLETTDGGVQVNADGAANGDIILDAADEVRVVTGDPNGLLVQSATYDHKIKYFPISAGWTTVSQCIVGSGTGLTCVGLSAGAAEVGSTEGFCQVDDAADFLRFSIALPDDFVDTGLQADLLFQFDIDEQAAEVCNIDVLIYEYDGNANTNAIITDALVAANDGTRAMKELVTNSAGVGNEADLGQGDHLIFEITATADTDDFNIYGMQMIYRCGIQATQ